MARYAKVRVRPSEESIYVYCWRDGDRTLCGKADTPSIDVEGTLVSSTDPPNWGVRMCPECVEKAD